MACHFFPGGVVCTSGRRRKHCKTPGHETRAAAAECDWRLHRLGDDGKPIYTGATCDRPMCDGCRKTVGRHASGMHKGQPKDLCPSHAAEAERRGLLAKAAELAAAVPSPPTPHELWLEAAGDQAKYRELMIKHGHLTTPGQGDLFAQR